MTLISYAQNFEDVLLWRALSHVGAGFYVDVGAQHPRIDSVSQLFHERGWHGIHVEPSSDYAAMLRSQRPGDEVIEAALSAERGYAIFHEVSGTGLSTLAQAAKDLASARGFKVRDRTVSTMQLDDVLSGVDGPVHWLKIDVEGHEQAVIDGWTNEVRPWVLLVESTQPGSRIEAYHEWQPAILAKGYRFVWFDGLNRFYVHADHPELEEYFGTPPNVFDAFALSGEATSSFANLLNARVAELRELAAERRPVDVEQDPQIKPITVENTENRTEMADPLTVSEAERIALLQRVAELEDMLASRRPRRTRRLVRLNRRKL